MAQVPEEMKRRDEEKESTSGLLGSSFTAKRDKEEPAAAPAVQNELPPTGEIVLGHEEAEAGLELALEPGEAGGSRACGSAHRAGSPSAEAGTPARTPSPRKAGAAPPPGTPDPQEQQRMQRWPNSRPCSMAPQARPVEEVQDAPKRCWPWSRKLPCLRARPSHGVCRGSIGKQAKSAPEAAPEVEPEPETAFQFFGKGADENEPQAPTRTEAPARTTAWSLPLMGLEEDEAPARPAAPAEGGPGPAC